LPADVTLRDSSILTSGSGRLSGVVADAGGPVTGTSYGGKTATTDVAAARAEMWTFVLAPNHA
jgi:hypothetical protein